MRLARIIYNLLVQFNNTSIGEAAEEAEEVAGKAAAEEHHERKSFVGVDNAWEACNRRLPVM